MGHTGYRQWKTGGFCPGPPLPIRRRQAHLQAFPRVLVRGDILWRKGGSLSSGKVWLPNASAASAVGVDSSSLSSPTSALRSHSAAVGALDDVMTLPFDAAADTGVYRFVPSDWSLGPGPAQPQTQRAAYLRGTLPAARASGGDVRGVAKDAVWASGISGPLLDRNLRATVVQIGMVNHKPRPTTMSAGPWPSCSAASGEMENRAVFVQTCARSPSRTPEPYREALGTALDNWDVRCAGSSAVYDYAMRECAADRADDAHVLGSLVQSVGC
ncbi:hypothetical protein MAPG_08484 [Magnaporthiopsis poae ATCC 64411]|uniref:Uncharacterized protein n=1 Tax=Magnaporthiopsis poae (strain ATCC 64411 / 73-15) TaxID=644358 RepID=A0A0C4E7H1_MAGP6|nr:hypothetical protein MAPG_08484 [Magnaporthiopsis poae ATCC 64411]